MNVFLWFKKIIVFLVLFFLIDFGISEVLLIGLNKYFGLNSNSEVLVNGSSMFVVGLDKGQIEEATNKKVAFYSRNGAGLLARNAMLKHYFNATTEKTDISILEINPKLFNSDSDISQNIYVLFLPFIDDPAMNKFVKDEASFRDYWIRKVIRTSRYDVPLIMISLKGHLGLYESKKDQVIDANVLEGLKGEVNSRPIQYDPDKMTLFKKTVKLVQKNSTKTILVNMPMFDTYTKTYKGKEFQEFVAFIKSYADENENILFLDLNQEEITKDPKYFSDPKHLNSQGQVIVTESLIKFIDSNK